MSRPVLEALLSQRSQGRLTGSALECWVERFEVYHSQTFGGRHEEDVELQFQALNREFEAEYATVSLDSSVPQHTPLDCSASRTRPARQKGLARPGPSPALATGLAWPGPALASPRVHQAQPSNVARQLKQQEGRDQGGTIVLGREPDAKPTLPTAARFPFLQRLAGRQEPTYEEVAAEAARRRKQETPLPPRPRSATPRSPAGPDATLLEELYEEVGGAGAEVHEDHRPIEGKCRAPLQRLHDGLFRGLTAVLPWRLMRRVYWRDGSGEQRFTDSGRARRRAGRKVSEVHTS